jgi:hypothetical protein
MWEGQGESLAMISYVWVCLGVCVFLLAIDGMRVTSKRKG